ncbi:MAG: hypothetical protein M3437_16580 [Chloroflexota bacterium]|nr:hypothetical protein [Chloroflexota bacterium]MDQ5864804.1 hypothetical protein [Chloroflexota bacterium]
MAKKGSRPSKANQQRSREEQWRRRAAAQAGGATSLVDTYTADGRDGADLDDDTGFTAVEVGTDAATLSARSTPASRATQTRTQAAATTASAQRRATSLTRQGRARLTPNVMSIEDEMYYVRSDIRRLILLTVACVVVLVLLYFVIPK